MMHFCIADGTNCGCLAQGTRIRIVDGREIFIENLRVGDMVMNPIETNKMLIVEDVWKGVADENMIKLEYGNGSSLILTPEHPVHTIKGVFLASEIKDGDEVLTEDSSSIAITKVSVLPVNEINMVYNLTLSDRSDNERGHFLIAEGLVVGDMSMQNRLAYERRK